MAQTTPTHLLNTSWTIHRLSPLHHNEFHALINNPAALNTYAARLRDHLTNSLAEAQGWTEDLSSVSSIGALQTCTWGAISTLSFLESSASPQSSEDGPCGILVSLTYENNVTYKAALLAPSSNDGREGKGKGKSRATRSTRETSTYLPLLLTRLPKSLCDMFIAFLSASFDSFCSPLRLSPQFMCTALRTYTGALLLTPESLESPNPSTQGGLLEETIREMQLTLSFSAPVAPALKTLNVNIPRGSLTSFVAVSESSSPESGDASGEGVLSGLEGYLQKHLAIELGLSGVDLSLIGHYVRLSRIACAGFVVASDGRLKLVVQRRGADEGEDWEARNRSVLRACEALLHAVVQRAVTEGLE